jgi:hypothetical protein
MGFKCKLGLGSLLFGRYTCRVIGEEIENIYFRYAEMRYPQKMSCS